MAADGTAALTSRTGKPDLATDLARFAAGIDTARLAPEVIEAVKVNILDTMACSLAGSSAAAIGEVADLVKEWGGAPQADMWAFGGKFPAHHAAWVNGAMSHARDYDDTHDSAVLHAGVTAVPAAVAIGQMLGGISGADLIAAVAAGLEITSRLGLASKQTIIESGFIYTPLMGTFGAAASAGRALKLTEEEMLNCFGIVYSYVAGNHQVTRDASHMKRIQPGIAAQSGVIAAQLAKKGLRGSQNTFEGIDGFFRVYLQDLVDPEVARRDLGTRFDLVDLSYKPYPCCRANHTAVDATLELRAKGYRPAEEIEKVDVGVTAQGYQIVCTPEEVRRQPKTVVQAQFAIPYTVSCAWVDGKLSLAHFNDEALKRPDTLGMALKVKPYVDEQLNRERGRGVTQAKVKITFKDGQVLETRVDDALGHPNNPMTDAHFLAKAEDCARYAAREFPADTAQRLIAAVSKLESAKDISGLMGVIA